MCGINGFIASKEATKEQLLTLITQMNDFIVHRGPDDDGVFIETHKGNSIVMGMRRLAIIDLSSGKQPIYSEDKMKVIVFNGEIYNYKTLRKELEIQGVAFKTESDTEVILKLYEVEGASAFKKLEGMFAFSIYDQTIDKLFIARDFFGEKPLYYTTQDDKFIWASELKSIINNGTTAPEIDKTGLNLFFKLTYIPAPYTIYKNIYKLEANQVLTYDLKTHLFNINPIEDSEAIEKQSISFREAQSKVNCLVEESVVSRAVSDVPIGTFLSGGVDSSIVSLCLARNSNSKINTFSIGFKNKSFDESTKAKTVANLINSTHHEFIIDESDLEEHIEGILNNFDEPFADSSALPTFLVANKTSQFVKVALTGDGGDEVFGGYNKYYMGKINQKYTQVVPEKLHRTISKMIDPLLNTNQDVRGKRFMFRKLIKSIDYSNNYYWDIISLGFSSNSLATYLKPEYVISEPFQHYKEKTKIGSPKNLTDYRSIDKEMSLEGDMLVKVDRTSMLSSLECRAPFLNKTLWHYTKALPEDYLIKGWDKKHILKKAFEKDFPKDFLNKSKSGFGVPVGNWLRSILKNELESYIAPKFLEQQSIFHANLITQLVREHLNGKDHTFMVWSFYCFQKWYINNYKLIF